MITEVKASELKSEDVIVLDGKIYRVLAALIDGGEIRVTVYMDSHNDPMRTIDFMLAPDQKVKRGATQDNISMSPNRMCLSLHYFDLAALDDTGTILTYEPVDAEERKELLGMLAALFQRFEEQHDGRLRILYPKMFEEKQEQ